MADFIIHFIVCNVFISVITIIFLVFKHILRSCLSGRMQYNLWYFYMGLLAVPFFSLCFSPFSQKISLLLTWLKSRISSFALKDKTAVHEAAAQRLASSSGWLSDFTLSVSGRTTPAAGSLLCGIWILGMILAAGFLVRSALRLHTLKKSALPLQNQEIHKLYRTCLREAAISREIPVYSTAFLKSPVITGLIKPCIYVPIHLICDSNSSTVRYLLLHELQHYKHHDLFAGCLMNLVLVLYWFNPLIWYARKEMYCDREIACDTSVLDILEKTSYEEYGNALISLAARISAVSFPFTAGVGGSKKQIYKRILNIAAYQRPAARKKRKSAAAFLSAAALLLAPAPLLAAGPAADDRYQWDTSGETISLADLGTYFGDYEGSFVLYDLKKDAWTIYNMEQACLRVPPDSTYKIYDALFGLESGVITSEDSLIPWDHTSYPFEAWNTDQTLQSAMQASVNWYFQEIDRELGAASVSDYIRRIGYGNEDTRGPFPTYWLESSLKISPLEQVILLTKLHQNAFDFAPENVRTVKEAIRLHSSVFGTMYGKTGTGRVDGQDISGWFVGYIEGSGNTIFFATNIKAQNHAAGSGAADITMSILKDIGIWQ